MRSKIRHLKLVLLACTSTLAIGCSDSAGPSAPKIGEVEVTIVTDGDKIDLDSDGYVIQLDDAILGNVSANESVAIHDLGVGRHLLQLSGLAFNCTLTGPQARWITIYNAESIRLQFYVSCHPSTGGDGWDY